jgi:hypothetical protein
MTIGDIVVAGTKIELFLSIDPLLGIELTSKNTSVGFAVDGVAPRP